MSLRKSSIELEKATIRKMIKLYCRIKHNSKQVLCDDCRRLLVYTWKRLDMCTYRDNKPTCEKCPVHCYNPNMRERVKIVMRYAGPRMIIFHPLDAIRHMLKGKNNAGGNNTVSPFSDNKGEV